MAKFNYEDYEKQSTNYANDRKVGYFNSLKNDGDEAIIRLVYDSPSDFDLVSVHKVKVGDYFRDVYCLREPNESLGKCPLCESGEKLNTVIYVKLVQYVADEDGKIVAKPAIWRRPAKFTRELKAAYDEYCKPSGAKLSDVVFKVKRFGAKGSMDTTYKLIFANPMVYKDSLYCKDFSDFDNYNPEHHDYLVKTEDEIKEYLNTGSFPSKKKNDDRADSDGGESSKSYAYEETSARKDLEPQPKSENVSTEREVEQRVTYARTTSQSTSNRGDGGVRPTRRYSEFDNSEDIPF